MNTNLKFESNEEIFPSRNKLLKIQWENNQLESIPKSIFNLKSLKSLEITNNPIKKLNYDGLSNMVNLEILELCRLNLKESFEIKSELKPLPKTVKILILSSLRLDYIPFDLSRNESSLNELVFSGIPWFSSDSFININDSFKTPSRRNQAGNITINRDVLIEKLNEIFQKEESIKIFNYFDSSRRGFLNIEELNKLNAFLFKRFPRLGGNSSYLEYGGITEGIFKLSNLRLLNLSYQAIKFIPDQIENLKQLEKLFLSDCILLETISPKLSGLKELKELNLNECISLKTPPPEIIKRGFPSIISYLKKLSTGSVQCKRTKLMLVGLGEAGKTSLLNSLISRKRSKERPLLTDGIDINDWIVDLEDKTQLIYSMWDFAGQSVYYNTHQFFLTSRAVYLLVWYN